MRLDRTAATLLTLGLVGAAVLGGPAYALAARDFPLYESVAEVRLLSDPPIGDEDAAETAGSEYVATELVVLNSEDLQSVVRQRQDDSDLQIEAVQVGTSNVVELTTRSQDRGLVGTTEVLRRYGEVRRAGLVTRIGTLRVLVDQQVTATTQAIVRLSDTTSPALAVQRAALETELSRLLQQRSSLDLAEAASARLVQVVSGGSQIRQAVSPLRDAALGGLAGALLGLGAGLLLLRLRPRVRGLQDLVALSPEVALPTLPHLPGRDRSERAGTAAAPYTAALSVPGSPFGTPPLAVLAPTAGVGATTVAVGLAVASARRRPTVLVAAGDALDGEAARLLAVDPAEPAAEDGSRPTRHPGLRYLAPVEGAGDEGVARLEAALAGDLLGGVAEGTAVVVDCPALTASPAGLELARRCGRVLLVGGVDRSAAAELEAAARSVERAGAALAGLVLSTPSRLPRLGRRPS